MKGIDLYKEVVINQNREYLGKEFRSEIGHIRVVSFGFRYISPCYASDRRSPQEIEEFMKAEWEEVKQPVSLNDALTHMLQGYVAEFKGEKYKFCCGWLVRKDTMFGCTLSEDMVKGEWFID